MRAWNGWYHVNGNTYGTWLRGDPRGWRARHHREHVDGDYKNPPPPGTYDRLLASSRRLMRRDEVRLSVPARRLACRELAASLLRHRVEVIAISVDDHHFHLLARFPKPTDRNPWACAAPDRADDDRMLAIIRHFVGIAKKDSAQALAAARLVDAGGVWAKRCRALAIRDREHQVNVFDYIVRHANEGAAVWTFRDKGKPPASKRCPQAHGSSCE